VTARSDLADRFLDALARYDVDALGPLLDEGCVRWLNLSGEVQRREELLAVVALERDVVVDPTFDVRHRAATDDGFVLQLTAAGTTRGGTPFRIPVCLVVTVDAERITRIDEYASSHHVAPLLQEVLGET
jgi:ketosteroid isomerase-like protein